eukprot:467773-Rhodomonas_salina.1
MSVVAAYAMSVVAAYSISVAAQYALCVRMGQIRRIGKRQQHQGVEVLGGVVDGGQWRLERGRTLPSAATNAVSACIKGSRSAVNGSRSAVKGSIQGQSASLNGGRHQ